MNESELVNGSRVSSLQYAEMEMRHRFVNHARNVWDRAVSLLPRMDQLWYKYIHMEEMLGNVAGARQVFERWMRFEPDHMGWMAYVRVGAGWGGVGRRRRRCGAQGPGTHGMDGVRAGRAEEWWIWDGHFGAQRPGPPGVNGLCCLPFACNVCSGLDDDHSAPPCPETPNGLPPFMQFELRYNEVDRARAIFERYVQILPTVKVG